MAVGDVYQFILNQLYAGQQIQNTFYFRTKDAADPGAAQFTALADDLKGDLREVQVNTLSYTGWLAQQVRGGDVSYTSKPCQRQGGRRLEGTLSAPLTGVQIPDGLPPQAGWVSTFYTGLSGRRRRGRLFLSGIPESYQGDGRLTTAAMTAITTAWTATMAAYGPTGTSLLWTLGVWSHTTASGCTARTAPPWGLENTAAPAPENAFNPVTVITPRSIIYTQRRRTIGRGR